MSRYFGFEHDDARCAPFEKIIFAEAAEVEMDGLIEVRKLPLSFFVDALNENHPFGFARYGDGEWSALLGARGANCDGQVYSSELGADLERTLLERRDYFYAIGPKAMHKELGQRVEQWLVDHAPRLIWYDTEVFLNASLMGELRPFVNALRRKRVLLVGPPHLARLKALNAIGLVVTPDRNAYAEKARLEIEILKQAELADVILFSAGPAAKVMLYDLYPQLKTTHTLIDCGSLWDVYCGVNSRRYARRMGLEEKQRLCQLNLGIRFEVR